MNLFLRLSLEADNPRRSVNNVMVANMIKYNIITCASVKNLNKLNSSIFQDTFCLTFTQIKVTTEITYVSFITYNMISEIEFF